MARSSTRSKGTGSKSRTDRSGRSSGSGSARENHSRRTDSESEARAKIRMYRQGFGDCFLITIFKRDGSPYRVLIDCGVIMGTDGGNETLRRIADDIRSVSDGWVDLLVITHEHWDHVNGFAVAREVFENELKFGEIWYAWTEDLEDPLATKLREDRNRAINLLAAAHRKLTALGADRESAEIGSVLQFFGIDPADPSFEMAFAEGTFAASTAESFQNPRRFSADTIRLKRPSDPPFRPDGLPARFFVLGPPYDEDLIKQSSPTASEPETFKARGQPGDGDEAASGRAPRRDVFRTAELAFMMDDIEGWLSADKRDSGPFGSTLEIHWDEARAHDFFKKRYFRTQSMKDEEDVDWRQIEALWHGAAVDLALQLDEHTNNTSLALAIELEGGDVLLFAADAQVGSWMSWHDLAWEEGHDTKTGPDLLKRTVFYKVSHHGSHNGTLKEKGLEMMGNLKWAMIPVDHETAAKKGWTRIPLPSLICGLEKQVAKNGGVLRSDVSRPSIPGQLEATDLYYEVMI